MELLVPVALYGWLPIVLVIFRDLHGHRALVVAYVAAWLFLPSTGIQFSGLPDYTKVSATAVGVMLAIFVSEPRRLFRFRPHPIDIFMLAYCFCPIPSALSNSLGLWDGCSNSLGIILTWGVPYFQGRMYFDSFEKIKAVALGIFVGGLIYIPFCLVEIRMSPQMYNWVYGFRPNTMHSYRYGGWRPVVFLSTGLELGMWMTAASLMGFTLWYSSAVRKIRGIGIGTLLLCQLATTILCKSTGALLLLIMGVGTLVLTRTLRTPLPMICVLLLSLGYIGIRSTNLSDGSEAVRVAAAVFGEDRAQSLEFRLKNETLLVQRAWQARWFGWGGWGREKVQDEYGEHSTIVDGMWIITFGKYGLWGLLSMSGAFLIAPTYAAVRFGRAGWRFAEVGAVLGIATLMLLYMIDCLLNAMANPLYSVALGGLATVCLQPHRRLVGDADRDAEVSSSATTAARGRLWPPSPRSSDGRELVGTEDTR